MAHDDFQELALAGERLQARQRDREKAQRDAATGRRARSILRGDLGPVLKRWVSGSVVPVAARLRDLSEAIQRGDLDGASTLAASPMFGLPDLTGSPDLRVIIDWGLASEDRLPDLVLTVMGVAISACASNRDGPIPLTRLLTACAHASREAAIGTFLTEVQGAKAMLRVRKSGKAAWAQRKKMDAVAAMMAGQVRSALGEDPVVPVRGKEVVSIISQSGDARRIDLRRPAPEDWKLLDVARRTKGERDVHLGTWCSFAMLVLCCAQAEAGWFDLVKIERKNRSHMHGGRKFKAAHGVALSEGAYLGIKHDLDRWLSLGFIHEPMLVPPLEGDYVTVKHREIAGGRGPLGVKTSGKGTTAWAVANETMAATPWTVPERTLAALRDSEAVRELAARSEPDEGRRELILAGYRRLAQDEFYMPLFMDFRGRVYSRSNLVTYQGRDLQKGLLCLPRGSRHTDPGPSSSSVRASVLHISALYSGPRKLDKAAFGERYDWFMSHEVRGAQASAEAGNWESPLLQDLLQGADDPIQLLTALTLQAPGQGDRLACQIDGTCNGLQHLSALFGDDTAAPYVNLTASSLDGGPRDIYAEVAARVLRQLESMGDCWARRVRHAVKVDRKLCKKPVMVLPYGGTRATIEEAVLEAILEQDPVACVWTDGVNDDGHTPWLDWERGNYQTFQERDLKDHPLLHLDAKRLGGLVWEAIVEILPKPMAAMQAFRDLAKAVGPRALEWSTGYERPGEEPLWVVQAKAKSERTGLKFKGLNLPGSVRGLMIRPGRDEIDAHSHVTGIIANFIHSQDAAHQTRAMAYFRKSGGRSFGAIFDCYITRPSEMKLLGEATRVAFETQYVRDPLAQPVRIRDPKAATLEEYPSWYALAEAYGVTFPARGTWKPAEVRDSAWFFS